MLDLLNVCWSRLAYVEARGETDRRAALVMARLRDYQQEHGRLPADLSALGDDETLTSALTGERFGYEVEDGKPRLWWYDPERREVVYWP